jgi:hypothetical protein
MSAVPSRRLSAPPDISLLTHKTVDSLDQFVARRWMLCFASVLTLSVVLAGIIASARPLEHDEIYTYYVASQSSLRAVYTALLNHADNHPPIDYWMRHISMEFFGPGELAFRLPSLVAFAGSVVCLFALVRRHLGPVCALIAALLIIASQASSLAYYGRSYSSILLWSSLSLLLWRMNADGRYRTVALIGLAFLFGSALSLHFYAPFHLIPVVVAELVRSLQRRAIDWKLWLAFGCAVASLPVVAPLLPYAQSMSGHFWSPVTLQFALAIYPDLFIFSISAVFFVLVVWAIIQWRLPDDRQNHDATSKCLPTPELWAAISFCLLPLGIFLLAKRTGALQAKYAVSFVAGVAILTALSASRAWRLRIALLIVMTPFALGMLGTKALSAVRAGRVSSDSKLISDIAESSDIPVVVDSSQTFLQSGYYASPSVRRKLFVLVDLAYVNAIGHENTDQIALPGLARISPFQVVPRETFIREHPVFLLVYEGGWLLRKMIEDHATITPGYFGKQPVFRIDTTGLNP